MCQVWSVSCLASRLLVSITNLVIASRYGMAQYSRWQIRQRQQRRNQIHTLPCRREMNIAVAQPCEAKCILTPGGSSIFGRSLLNRRHRALATFRSWCHTSNAIRLEKITRPVWFQATESVNNDVRLSLAVLDARTARSAERRQRAQGRINRSSPGNVDGANLFLSLIE